MRFFSYSLLSKISFFQKAAFLCGILSGVTYKYFDNGFGINIGEPADLLDKQNEDTNHDNTDDIDHGENETDHTTKEQLLRDVSVGCIFEDKSL